MSDDLETRLAAALRAAAEQHAVEDRWDRIAEHPSRREPPARRTLRRSLPVLVAAAVIVIGLAVAAVVVTTRGSRVAGVTDEVATTAATTAPATTSVTTPATTPATTGNMTDATSSSAATPSGSASGSTSIDLPTSDWSGGGGDAAALGGTLRLDADGCVRVDDVDVVWPRGFSARTVGGELELLDADGAVVARGGDQIFTGGGFVPHRGDSGCSRDVAGESFMVQSEVQVVGVPVELPTSAWHPGDFSMEALLGGAVQLDTNGCVTVGGSPVVWPAGWTARTSGPGVEILDGAGRVVARSYQVIQFGGGFVPVPADQVTRCSPAKGALYVQSGITVVG